MVPLQLALRFCATTGETNMKDRICRQLGSATMPEAKAFSPPYRNRSLVTRRRPINSGEVPSVSDASCRLKIVHPMNFSTTKFW
jgi:hypothetical protein